MKKLFLLIIGLCWLLISEAQKLSYDVSFPNIDHHEAVITLTASDIPRQKAVFRMSRSSPGRYATHEFGKNVYYVKAFDKAGKEITINRVDADVYEVPKQDGFVKVQYTLYADHPDGTYAGIDATGIHLNMPASFMWIKGFDKAPIDIRFNIPAGKKWSVATQLKPTADAQVFTAPGLQYFMDSPTKIGDLIWKGWNLKNPDGKTYTFHMALQAETSDSLAQAFADKIKRITEEAKAVYGEVPDYDYGTYTFITSINPYVKGDGMEHRNSTMISLPVKFNGSNSLLEVFAHEFFHCWNVERIRPKSLEPFNFEKSNMSSELWCAEGFTQYYGDLLVTRSDLQSMDDFLGSISRLINTKENTPGAKVLSPAEMSRNAVFVDAGVSIDRNNYVNTFTSYYPYGGAIALALELELRTKFNLSMDDYMTALWKRFGKPEVPYTIPGLEEVLAQLVKDKKYAADFFSNYCTGHQSFDYKPLLAKAGFLLKNAYEGKAWIGRVQYKDNDNGVTISSNTVTGTPLFDAGLDFDDTIIQLDGKPVKRQSDLNNIVNGHKPGDQLQIEFIHHGEPRTATITLTENLYYSVVPYEKEGLTVTDEMKKFRADWMGSHINK